MLKRFISSLREAAANIFVYVDLVCLNDLCHAYRGNVAEIYVLLFVVRAVHWLKWCRLVFNDLLIAISYDFCLPLQTDLIGIIGLDFMRNGLRFETIFTCYCVEQFICVCVYNK